MFSEFSLATTITVLTSVSCYCMTLLNYGDKKTRDVGFTCKCNLSNIVPDSIFYDSMGWWITQFLLLLLLFSFLRGGNRCLPQHRRDGFSIITITPMGMGKPYAIKD